MIRVCFSESHLGDRIMGEKEPFEDRSETHGLCDGCLKLELEKIGERKERKNEGSYSKEDRKV